MTTSRIAATTVQPGEILLLLFVLCIVAAGQRFPPPDTPAEVSADMWELSRAVGFDYGLGRVTKPYSVEMRLLLSGGLDSPYLTVKAHSLNLILSILKYSEIPRRELIEGVRPLGSKFAQSRLEQSASVRESSIADLPTLVAHLSKRVVWTADVLAAEDFEGRYVQIEKTLNGLQERDTREQEYYALETVNYLADLGTDRARKIVSADLDKHGPAVKKVLTLGLKKVDLRLEQSKLDPDSQIALMTKSVLDSPQTSSVRLTPWLLCVTGAVSPL